MKSQYVRVSHWALPEGGWVVVVVLASCVAIPLPLLPVEQLARAREPHLLETTATPPQSKGMLAAQNLPRAHQCAEGI